MPSKDSSPDSPTVHDRCGQCPHERRHHGGGVCILCTPIGNIDRHSFVPAEPETAVCKHPNKRDAGSVYDGPGGRKTWLYYRCDDCDAKWREEETAGEPDEPCINSGGCRYLTGLYCAHGCREAADAVTRLGQEMEPEAPECKYPGGCPLTPDVCPPGVICAFDAQLKGERMMPRPEARPPRRPPYAVAYEIGDGRLYEVALSGDAVATVEDGVLKVSHPAGVKALVQVKPIEGPR